ncbi:MAG: hypothetical protein KAX63_02865 [Pseudomonas sp.]|nr:hypothetical protein [Pseudomonas sp.]
MNKIILIAFSGIILSGCVAPGVKNEQARAALPTDNRECAQNFTFDGSFLAGRTFKTHATLAGVAQATGMQRAARYLATSGWNISNTDKELGIISASQTVSYGQGKSVPLNVAMEPQGNALRVSVTYVLSGGVTSPVEAVRNEFCSVITAVAG